MEPVPGSPFVQGCHASHGRDLGAACIRFCIFLSWEVHVCIEGGVWRDRMYETPWRFKQGTQRLPSISQPAVAAQTPAG